MAWRDQLVLLWEHYLLDGASAPLLSFIEANSHHMVACGHAYPQLHRICDVSLERKAFRVTRCLTCGLSFRSISSDIASEHAGVPWWLKGEKLARWVNDVSEMDPEEDTDWEQYR